jgi:hypothetical protein
MIRVFVGCAPNHDDAESQAVLEYTLRQHASEEVEITWMRLSRNPTSPFYSDSGMGWRTERWATPFSGFRWAIPKLCNFDGRAIYTDSDVIFMADVAELWRQEIPRNKVVLAKGGGQGWRYCVSLWDCYEMRRWVPGWDFLLADPEQHLKLCKFFASRPDLVQPFEGNWNCLDGEDLALDDPALKVLHYTDMSTQPHLKYALNRMAAKGRRHWYNGPVRPHRRPDVIALFDRLLAEAEAAGYPVSKYEQEPPYGEISKADLRNYKGRSR